MSLGHGRARAALTIALASGLVLAGCAAGPNTDDSASTAMVESFLGHLEAGESTAAAALTALDFPAELVADAFYSASASIPSGARIVKTTGYDSGLFTATVEYTLGTSDSPVSLDITVNGSGSERAITGWTNDLPLSIGPYPAAGTVRVNDTLDYTLAAEGNTLTLLPAEYSFAYSDPTGLMQLVGGQSSDFTVTVPSADGLSLVPTVAPDVMPAIAARITRLQTACRLEGFTGPSCPLELTTALAGTTPPTPQSGEWFRQDGPDLVLDGQAYRFSATYLFHSDEMPTDVTVSYGGGVARDASGAVVITR